MDLQKLQELKAVNPFEQLKKKYPHITKGHLKAIVMSQFKFVAKRVLEDDRREVLLFKLGKFRFRKIYASKDFRKEV